MSGYTTGEMAKRCGVTVRTVQYYDTCGLLPPSALSEGGRRLYSQDDLLRLQVICFLRGLNFSIDAISRLLAEDDPSSVIDLLIAQQAEALSAELAQKQAQLDSLNALRREVKSVEHFSVEAIADIATFMKTRKNLKKIHLTILLSALPVTLWEIFALLMGILKGTWWPLLVYVPLAVLYAIWVSRYYFRNVAYICPQCHKVFKPKFKEAFRAKHTPKTRRLTCPECGHFGYCVETAAEPLTDGQ